MNGIGDISQRLAQVGGGASRVAGGVGGGGGASFEEALKQAGAKGEMKAAREAAGSLVAHALILPVLKQLRRGTWGQDTPFSAGIGEKTFGPEFDMQIADRVAHSPRMGVTDALAKRLLGRGGTGADSVKALYGKAAASVNGVDLNG